MRGVSFSTSKTLRFLLTAGVFVWIFTRIDPHKMGSALGSAAWGWYAVAFAIILIQHLLATAAVHRLMNAVGVRRPYLEVLRMAFSSFFFSLLGGWAGGLARWRSISGSDKRHGEAFFVIIAETYLMLLVATAVFGVFFPWEGYVHFPVWQGKTLAIYAACLGAGLLAGAAAYGFDGVYQFFKVRTARRKRLSDLMRVWDAARRSRADVTIALVFCVVYTFVGMAAFQAAARGAGISVGWITVAWLCAIPRMVQVVPLTIGGIGIAEGIFMLCLASYGVPAEKAFLVGFFISLTSIVCAITGGVWYMAHHLYKANAAVLPLAGQHD